MQIIDIRSTFKLKNSVCALSKYNMNGYLQFTRGRYYSLMSSDLCDTTILFRCSWDRLTQNQACFIAVKQAMCIIIYNAVRWWYAAKNGFAGGDILRHEPLSRVIDNMDSRSVKNTH